MTRRLFQVKPRKRTREIAREVPPECYLCKKVPPPMTGDTVRVRGKTRVICRSCAE